MQTDRLCAYLDVVPVNALHKPGLHPAQCAVHDLRSVGEHRPGSSAIDQCGIRVVPAIREVFVPALDPGVRSDAVDRWLVRYQEMQVAIERDDRIDDCPRLLGIGTHPVVQRAMGFDVSHRDPVLAASVSHCAKLPGR